MLLLYLTLGSVPLVFASVLPVMLAVPATLGLMGWLSLPVTIINTVIPAIVLVIGVADAVHMVNAWRDARTRGDCNDVATRKMLRMTGKACFFTTITTIGGFIALTSAELRSVGPVRDCSQLRHFARLAGEPACPAGCAATIACCKSLSGSHG